MPTVKAGVFTLDYTLYTNAEPGADIQFGMDFTLTSTTGKPLCQLIFPAVAVGRNQPGQWNIDNHSNGNDAAALVFSNAQNGTITDTPREISPRGRGSKSTKFAIFLVDLSTSSVQTTGVNFGYTIDTGATTPQTAFTGFSQATITNEQKQLVTGRCSFIKFK